MWEELGGKIKFAWRQGNDKSRRIQNIRGSKTENPGSSGGRKDKQIWGDYGRWGPASARWRLQLQQMGNTAAVSDPREEQLLSARKSLQGMGAHGWQISAVSRLCSSLVYLAAFLPLCGMGLKSVDSGVRQNGFKSQNCQLRAVTLCLNFFSSASWK